MMNLTNKKGFQLILELAENKNPELWNCIYDLNSDGLDLELDQGSKCGNDKNELLQIGSGELKISKFRYQSSLN